MLYTRIQRNYQDLSEDIIGKGEEEITGMLILYIGISPRYKLRSQLIIQIHKPPTRQISTNNSEYFHLLSFTAKRRYIYLKGQFTRERWPNDGGHFGIDWFQNIKHSKLDTCATIFCTYLSCSLLFFMPTISILNKVEKIIMYVSRCLLPPF